MTLEILIQMQINASTSAVIVAMYHWSVHSFFYIFYDYCWSQIYAAVYYEVA